MTEPKVATTTAQGVLEIHPRGFGFLRSLAKNFAPQPNDAYVSAALIQRHGLKEGLLVSGTVSSERGRSAPPERGGRSNGRDSRDSRDPSGPRLADVLRVDGVDAQDFHLRDWDELTPIDPHQKIRLETGAEPLTTRVMDLFTPIGKGQRGLIVAPPRSGKTVLLQQIAHAVATNHPEMHLMVLLVDERPEEVTDTRRTVKGEVIASSSDQDAAVHVRVAELCMERAKRLAEQGKQVFVLLDSLTRLARAYNKVAGNSGKTMTGGIDSRAMDIPKRLFGSARVFEEGGSITIMGTALVETGSRMDDVIFEEFKGTGNMEMVLDRKLAERRVYPALDMAASGTRKEERLLEPDVLHRVNIIRRHLLGMSNIQAMESLLTQMKKSSSNEALFQRMVVRG